MVVPCVNYYDNTFPPACKYSAERVPTEDVNLNLDTDFLCGCDCEDDCADKLKCQCWQLTLAGAKLGNPTTPPEEVGYAYKRLAEQVPTGIYECNSNCKCNKTCLNRVAQQPLQLKLQVFKTGNRGWGLRCLNDVPKGSFICCYAGHLLSEQHANEAGQYLGDEYYADLDYIEMAENLKEGYEPDVENDDDRSDEEFDPNADDEEDNQRRRSNDSDDEFDPRAAGIEINTSIKKSYRTRTRAKQAEAKPSEKEAATSATTAPSNVVSGEEANAGSDEDEERQLISFTPHSSSGVNFEKDQDGDKYRSVRTYFGKDETAYIMDAKKCGNIGRYFNVSIWSLLELVV